MDPPPVPPDEDFKNFKSIVEWSSMEIDESQTLLGNRWLCRHGLACFVASSGQGKSVASIQCGILWGCGREAFGIKPSKPLRVLVIQGEDDEGDVIEMSRMLGALELSAEELELTETNTLIGRKNATGPAFTSFLEETAKEFRPDLVILNPLNNYIGSDDKDAKAWIELRAVFYRLMKAYDFGMLLFHHTPKTNFQSTSGFSPRDWQYRGAGTAGITNSIRAAIVMEPVPGKEHAGTYRFIGSKRGSRCGDTWVRGESGLHEKFFKHCSEPGLLFWEDAEPVVKKAKDNVNLSKLLDDIYNLVPLKSAKGKADLETEIQQKLNIGRDRAKECLKVLFEREAIYAWTFPKPAGTRGGPSPQGWSRTEQVGEEETAKRASRKVRSVLRVSDINWQKRADVAWNFH
jgi:hypothetical protein